MGARAPRDEPPERETAMNSWAVITGASAGIGEAFARRLHADGWRLVLAARRTDRLESLAAELGGEVRCVGTDLALEAERDALWKVVEALDGPVDLLVNNAGFGLEGAFADLDWGRQSEMIQVNVTALADLSRRYLALRGVTGGGALINIASVVGLRPAPQMAIYSGTKHFVVGFSLALAEELRHHRGAPEGREQAQLRLHRGAPEGREQAQLRHHRGAPEGREQAQLRAAGTRVLAVCPGPVPTEFQQVAGSRVHGASKLVAVSAEQVVDEALAALERGDHLWVPGAAMRWAARLAQLLPLPIAARLAARRPR